jgi:hypothetical protein
MNCPEKFKVKNLASRKGARIKERRQDSADGGRGRPPHHAFLGWAFPDKMNDSFWSKAFGCQADDCYELLLAFLKDRREILGVEAARFLGFDLEVVQPLLQRLVEAGVATATNQGGVWFYGWHEEAKPEK